ncbi:hypothetical protein ABH940_001363 [Streptacidiphilus sp. BW17]
MEMANGWISETWDRVVASDPGLHRLRMALSAAVAMTTTLAVEYGYARWTDAGYQSTVIAMLLGTVMAMMGSMALTGTRTWPKIRTAAFFPVAIGAGMLPGAAVAGHTDAMLVVFVAVMFLAVLIRRFGVAYFFYGFMVWMGYFFAAFLGARLTQLPTLLSDVVVASAWVLLLSVTALRTHPRRNLARLQRAFGARAGAVARASADLLLSDPDDRRGRARLHRRLHSRQMRLAETALVIEGWSGDTSGLPPGWSAPALRRRVLDAHLAMEEVATAAESLARTGGRLAGEAAHIAAHLARREDRDAAQRARALLVLDRVGDERNGHERNGHAAETGGPRRRGPSGEGDCLAGHLAAAALRYTAIADRAATPPEMDESEEFTPAVTLALGALPGSGAVAADVRARGSWNPFHRTSLTTRQAIQVAVAATLAIIAGREISQARYYWAVLAAFIAFAGTATRSETFIKAGNRVLGTLLGLGFGVALAHLTAGHTLWVLATVVASISCGFYLVNITYAGMIFFVTIMVSQLYSQLHEFSAHLLVLRLEETALGAAIGIAVAVLVLPTSTRDTVQAARSRYFTALAELLRATAAHLGRREAVPETAPAANLDALARAADLRLQQLALVARPLTRTLGRPVIWNNNPAQVRHRMTAYAALTRQTRALAASARPTPQTASGPGNARADLAQAAAALAEAAEFLAVSLPRPGRPAPEVAGPLATAETLLLSRPPADPAEPEPTAEQPLARLRRLLYELAILPPVVAIRPAAQEGRSGAWPGSSATTPPAQRAADLTTSGPVNSACRPGANSTPE